MRFYLVAAAFLAAYLDSADSGCFRYALCELWPYPKQSLISFLQILGWSLEAPIQHIGRISGHLLDGLQIIGPAAAVVAAVFS